MALVRRTAGGGGSSRGETTWSGEDSFCKDFPTLTEFLRTSLWPDGALRETGTLLLFVHDGCLKACLTDRDASLVAFTTAGSLGGLLAALERGLATDTLDWRPSKTYGGGARKKK